MLEDSFIKLAGFGIQPSGTRDEAADWHASEAKKVHVNMDRL